MSNYDRRRMPVHLGTARDEPDSYVSLVSCRRCGALLDPREDSATHERWHAAMPATGGDYEADQRATLMSHDLGVLLGTSWELQRVVHTLATAETMDGSTAHKRLAELADAIVETTERTVTNAGAGARRVRALVDALRAVQQ